MALAAASSAFLISCCSYFSCVAWVALIGGIAPDLRALDDGIDGDEWYMERARGGAVRNGNVYMPPFEGVLNQEAMWAIRAYLVSLPKE